MAGSMRPSVTAFLAVSFLASSVLLAMMEGLMCVACVAMMWKEREERAVKKDNLHECVEY